jgi:integrase
MEFGPKKLLALRELWIKKNVARHTINARVRRLRQIFKWGVSRELVPIDALHRLKTVESLQPNRGGRETSGCRGPVALNIVEATLPHLPELMRAFVMVALHTGARIGELSVLTTGQIDRTSDVWVANLSQHKTRHKGKSRRIYFGPKAQAALTPWLLDDLDAPIFSPTRIRARRAQRRGKNPPAKSYARNGFGQILRRAIRRGQLQHWSLAQLRHSAAVEITNEFGLEACRGVLGHSSVKMSEHYATESVALANKAMTQLG